MAVGSVPSPGIKYIRVNRYDNNSVDIANNIKYARHIRVDHGTNVRQYNIISAIVDPNDSGVYYLEVQAPYTGQPSGGTGLEAALVPNVNFDVSYSEYNALYSNANDNQVSRTKYIVERDTFDGVPSNLTNILTGFEQLAEIQDDLYTDSGLAGSRFKGSRNTSTDINIHTQGDGAIEQKPAVELTQDYFAYFKYIGGTSPEVPNKVAAEIKYLIGPSGSILDTNSDDIAQYLLQQNFLGGTEVQVLLDDPKFGGTDMSSLNGLKIVYRSGMSAIPIINNHAAAMPLDYAGDSNNNKYSSGIAMQHSVSGSTWFLDTSSTTLWSADGTDWIIGLDDLFKETVNSYDLLATGSYFQKGLTYATSDYIDTWIDSGELLKGEDYSVAPPILFTQATGYSEISVPYEIKPNDYITFQSAEYSNWRVVYQIIEIDKTATQLRLRLDRNVSNSQILRNKFSIIRLVGNPRSLILDINKPPGGTSGGIIKPKYVSKETEESIRKTISDMRQKGMI